MMELIEQLQHSRARLHAAVNALPADRWTAAPGLGWPPAMIVAHLTLVETRTIARLRKGEPPSGPTGGKETILKRNMPLARTKVKSPEHAVPVEFAATAAEGLAAFDVARNGTLEFLRTMVDLPAIGADHAYFGPLNGEQWILAMALHTLRHAAQIEAGASEL